jgi:hypothetical protein
VDGEIKDSEKEDYGLIVLNTADSVSARHVTRQISIRMFGYPKESEKVGGEVGIVDKVSG